MYSLRNLIAPSTEPVSRMFGWDRGTPIDRVYMEGFLKSHGDRIRGAVLEVGERTYTLRFGNGVITSDVLHATADNSQATLVGDLVSGRGLEDVAFDCIVLTQTLPFVSDCRAALGTLYRGLRPGGCLLATVPGLAQLSRYDQERWGDYWRFMPHGCAQLFDERFGRTNVTISTYGNLYCAARFLEGFCAEEIPAHLLRVHDPEYPITIGIEAIKR